MQGKKRHILLLVVIGIFVCVMTISLYMTEKQKNEEVKLQERAKIISSRVWAMDREGMHNDLNLIVTVEKYKYLEVMDNRTTLYVSVKGKELKGFEALCYKVGLIRRKMVSAIIFHENGPIGVLRGEKYFNIFVPVLLCFGGLSVFSALVIVILSLVSMRRNLSRDLKKQQSMLKESESRFKELVNQLPEIVWETDRYGKIEYANTLAHKRFFISQIGETFFFDLFHEKSSDSLKRDFEKIINGQTIALQELLACDYKNIIFPVLLKCSPRYLNGMVVGVRCLGMDITERVHLEKQLEHDRRVKELGMLAGGVAHNLNNMLAGVVGYSDLLLLEMNTCSREYEIIEEVHKAGLQAAGVVSDLLTAVRGRAHKKESCDLVSLLKEYFSSVDFQNFQRENPEVIFVVNFALCSAKMNVSQIHIRKIVMNLLKNSVEATDTGGTIVISVSSFHSDAEIICVNNTVASGDYVCLSVRDEGKGISSKNMKRIFEPFFSTKERATSGTGLGLSLVWNAAADHGAGIQVENVEKGCEVKILFPCDIFAKTESVERIELARPLLQTPVRVAGKGERILVVDDDFRQRQLVTKILSSHGFLVVTMESGEKAVRYLRTHQVDLVVIDIVLGLGIGGSQTYREILKLWPQQKALVVTGYTCEGDVEEILALGAYGIVNKPYTVSELSEAVAQSLEGRFSSTSVRQEGV